MFGGLHVAELLPRLTTYDAVAIALILARGLLGALQFVSGWLLATRRPQGLVLAQWALASGALLTILGVGLDLAPTSIYHWLRWQVTGAYVVYALGATIWLRATHHRP